MYQQKYKLRDHAPASGNIQAGNAFSGSKVCRKALFMAVWALPLLQSLSASAQWNGSRSQFFQKNSLKHYAITPVESKDEYFTAGTLYSLGFGNIPTIAQVSDAVHWMYFDNAGNTVMSKVLDDQECNENVVGAHMFNGEGVIVAGRFSPARQTASGLEILTVDGTGKFVSGKVINSSDPSLQSMFPLSSLRYNDRYLFVCGYMTNDQPGSSPDMGTDKKGFVLKYDIVQQTVVNVISLDAGGPQGSPACDIDIAARMKIVSEGIWVGGSVNDGPMMNLVLDPNTMAPVYNESFGVPSSSPGDYESSFDIMETSNGDKFVFGNTHFIEGTTELTPRPRWAHINAVQANYAPYPVNNRWVEKVAEYSWGNCVLPDDGGDENTAVLSGFATGRGCSNSPFPTSTDNINPFLFKLMVRMTTSGISVTPYYWNTLLSIQGTGNPVLSNSCYKLGRFRGNLAFAPATATRNLNVTTDMLLTAPVWNVTNRLNIKLVRTDRNATMQDCLWDHDCGIGGDIWSTVSGTAARDRSVNVSESFRDFDEYDFMPDYIDDCSGKYKPTGIDDRADLKMSAAVSIVPNPASDHISIVLKSSFDADAHFEVTLADMSGKHIATLYKGNVAGLAAIRLPAVASGAYMVTVSCNGAGIASQMLMIQ